LSIPGLLVGLGMLMGGLSMKRLGSRGVAQMGAIAGMIPIHPAWLLTLPIGIWAQVMLKKPQVKLAFRENARRRQGSFPPATSEPYGSAEAVAASLAPDSESIAQPAAETISRSESGAFLSKPEQPPARGFSTSFERAVGNVAGGVRRRGPGRIFSAPVMPGVMAMLLSLGGVVTMFVPWGVTRHYPEYYWYYAYDNPWGLLAGVVFFALGLTMLASTSFGRRPGWRPWTIIIAGSVLLGLLGLYYENVLKRVGVNADGSFFTAFGFIIALMVIGAWDLRCLLTATGGIHSAPSDLLRQANHVKSEGPAAVVEIRRTVRGPGIALMVFGFLLLFPALLLMTNGIDIADGNDGMPSGVGVMMVVGSLCLLGLCGLLIRGGWHMVALEKYNAALLASFLGQPVGLWGLMVLGRPEVKSAFAAGPSPGVRQQSAELRDRESIRGEHAIPNPFARMLLQFFTWIGILFAVSVLVYLARGGGDEESATLVYPDSGAVPDNEAGNSKSSLHDAAAAGQIGRIRQLLAERGIDINDRDSEGKTPLMVAAAADEAHLVALLMLGGADETLRDNDGKSALMHAVEAGHSTTVKLLIDMEKANWDEEFQFRLKRIDPESTKTLDFKSLHFEGGQNWQDKTGETSLMKAAARGDLVMFDTLRLWSDESLRDLQGRTAIVHAIEQRQVEFLTKLLERAEQYLSVRTPGHNFPVTVTPEILSLPDNSRRTPLDIAEEMELNEVAARIRSYLQAVVDVLSREIDATERVSVVKFLLIERGRAFRGLGDDEQAEADLKRSREIGEREK
ncbi:MAG TPA: ankyrin repeat domain-containing protein, partial [Planctomycetaceae bacterium]|nr:ankyrin repeat domain-containing protein [Planctomycetaceae bacterium]